MDKQLQPPPENIPNAQAEYNIMCEYLNYYKTKYETIRDGNYPPDAKKHLLSIALKYVKYYKARKKAFKQAFPFLKEYNPEPLQEDEEIEDVGLNAHLNKPPSR